MSWLHRCIEHCTPPAAELKREWCCRRPHQSLASVGVAALVQLVTSAGASLDAATWLDVVAVMSQSALDTAPALQDITDALTRQVAARHPPEPGMRRPALSEPVCAAFSNGCAGVKCMLAASSQFPLFVRSSGACLLLQGGEDSAEPLGYDVQSPSASPRHGGIDRQLSSAAERSVSPTSKEHVLHCGRQQIASPARVAACNMMGCYSQVVAEGNVLSACLADFAHRSSVI